MLSISRFARIFLVALVIVTIPTAFLFYPSKPDTNDGEISLEKGGIDSEHWRAPLPPPQRVEEEDEEARGWDQPGQDPAPAPVVEEGSGGKEWKGPNDNVAGDTGAAWEAEHGGAGAGSGGAQPQLISAEEGVDVRKGSGGAGGFESVAQDVMSGGVIMPHLGNATAKAELGRAAWRVLHLMTLRYPEHPTEDDRAALKSFFYLFSRLYPCGECAEHFQKMLKKYPPQTSSRKSASLWLCEVHNIVNERLGKPEFDCLTLDATYDCGCGDNSTTTAGAPATGAATATLDSAAD